MGPSDDFYLDLVMSADRVLDVGCGTGGLLHRARDAGHTGRLCGLDHDPTMRRQFGDWHRGPLTDTSEEIITIARRR